MEGGTQNTSAGPLVEHQGSIFLWRNKKGMGSVDFSCGAGQRFNPADLRVEGERAAGTV